MNVWQIPGLVVALLVLGVPLAAYLGAGPGVFFLFGLGVVLGMVCTIVLAASAAFASATGRPWRSAAVRATVVPLVLTLGVLAIGLGGAGHPIHDVTTDPEDRLAFTPDVAALEQLPMTREEVLAIQREIYPDLAPLELPGASDLVFARALDTAASMEGWEVIHSDAEAGRIEAAATSAIFHFVDDVVIQVEAIGSGSRIDVRSRSRMGRSDLGANAERIRAFLARLKAS